MSFFHGFNSAVSRVINTIFKNEHDKSLRKKRRGNYENTSRSLREEPNCTYKINENSNLYNTSNLKKIPVITKTVVTYKTVTNIKYNDDNKIPLKRQVSSRSIDYINFSCLAEDDINEIEEKFNKISNNGALTKPQFKELYNQIRTEEPERLEKISEVMFTTFDINKDGLITLDEFLTGYAITTSGNLRKKLDFLFQIYDRNNDGFLTTNEIDYVIQAIVVLFDVELKLNANEIAKECIRDLDQNDDGKISREEFVDGLMKNYALRSLMSPFN